MKRSLLIITAILLVTVCAVCLFGCASASGQYAFKSAKLGAFTYTAENVSAENVSLTLNDDGTYSFKFVYSLLAVNINEVGTWTKDGKTITFNAGDVSTAATYESGELTWDNGTYTFVFVKQ